MLIFDALTFQTRVVKMRPRQRDTCEMCSSTIGQSLSMTQKATKLNSFDYAMFCGVTSYDDKSSNVSLLDAATQRVTCDEFKRVFDQESDLLIDVRPECQFKICSLPHAISKNTLTTMICV